LSDLPVLAQTTDLERMADPAHYVELACERAKAWLADALEHGDIDQIVELKSQAEAIRIYTTQKKLGKDTELAACEVVRRAERGIAIAIRKGQEEGTIARQGQTVAKSQEVGGTYFLRSTTGAAGVNHTSEVQELTALADGISDEVFEEAIAEAKSEGNLSRANVTRKVRGEKREPKSVHYGRRHVDHYRVLAEAVATLDGLATAIGLVDVSAIPVQEREEWAQQLRAALRPLTKFVREVSHD
jgi:hypothetical protein